MRPARAPLAALLWAFAITPLLWAGLFATFVLRARLQLGRWPAPYRPDPRDLGFTAHHFLLSLTVPLPMVAALLVPVLAIACYRQLATAGVRPLWPAMVAVIGYAAILSWAVWDPGLLLYWFAD